MDKPNTNASPALVRAWVDDVYDRFLKTLSVLPTNVGYRVEERLFEYLEPRIKHREKMKKKRA